ncbi:hypothetical protein PFAG_02469 [Plasmodium falciparum Santa Lucia]|uniref:Uncharacterized protein n=1 Tax=Plasmodium falciparum Santa Lucia TaxID=478859 RepID=W7FR46_PLAFA|nr:hypothetical protein PFAG_02469 [Plasmodium falciparum Santa Lucia]
MLKKVILLTFYFFCCYKCEKFKDSSFQSQNNRFLQSKINVLTWLTNVLYPSENPKYFKKHLNYKFKELKIKNDQWYVLFVQEILKDIKIKAGIYGDLSVEYLRKSDDETDYNENKQGAVGLIANKGRCKFRNIVIYI